jgi:multiple sugar transport system substrate-binding protein
VAAVAGLALVALTAGCGGNGGGSGGRSLGKGSGSADDAITLAVQNGLVPQFQKIVKAYETAYPARKVTVKSLPDDSTQYIQQLVTERLGGKLDDLVMNVDSVADQLAAGHVTSDVSSWLKQGKDGLKESSFLPQFLGQYRPIGHPEQVTGMPVSADSTTLFFNRTLFRKYGVTEYPKADWTWSDLYRVASQIQQKSHGKVYGVTSPLGLGDQSVVYGPVIKAYGGYVYDPKTKKSGIGEPAALNAWKMLISFYGKASNKYTTTQASQPLFQGQQVAMTISVRAGVPTFKTSMTDDWDAQVMPRINGKSTVGGGSYGLSLASTSKHTNAAWSFLAWFYRTDGGMKVAQQSGQVIPPTADGLAKGIWRRTPAPPTDEQAFATDAENATLATQLPGKANGVLSTSVVAAIQQVVLQHKSIADAFGAAEQKVDQALADPGSAS